MMAQTSSAARIAPHQGHLVVAGSTSWTATTAAAPGVEANEKTIPPKKKKKISPHPHHQEAAPLRKKVDQFPRREENIVGADGREDDGDDQQAKNDRQHATLAGAQ